MKLYGSLTSPYVRKVRAALIELGAAFDFEILDVWAPGSGLDRLNPLAKAPVLEIDGSLFFDSFAILDEVNQRFAGRLIPSVGKPRADVLRLHALAQGLIDATVMRVLEGRRPLEARSATVLQREDDRIERTLDALEASGVGALRREALGLAEITLGVALLYTDFRDPRDWRDARPGLSAWLNVVEARACFATTAPP